MNVSKQLRVKGIIEYLIKNNMNGCLAYYIEGLETAGIGYKGIDKLIDKAKESINMVNKDFEKSIFGLK